MTNTLTHQSKKHSSYESLANAIRLLEDIRDTADAEQHAASVRMMAHKDIASKAVYLRECRTIGVLGYRQIGKTEWIIRNAPREALIIALNTVNAQGIQRRLLEKIPSSHHRPVLMTVKDLETSLYSVTDRSDELLLRGKNLPNYKEIILDEGSWIMDRIGGKNLYKMLALVSTLDTNIYMIG